MAIFRDFSKIPKTWVLYHYLSPKCEIWGSWGQKRPFYSQKRIYLVFRKYWFTQYKKIAKVHSRQTLLLLQFSIFFDATNFFENRFFRFAGESPSPRGKIPKTNEQVMCAIASWFQKTLSRRKILRIVGGVGFCVTQLFQFSCFE